MGFRFERLKVWPKAVEFVDQVVDISLGWPQALQSSLGDQVRRAGVSVVANIAEASGKRTGKSARFYYDTARGSVYEVIGIMTLVHKRKIMSDKGYKNLYNAGDEICAMLWGLMQASIANDSAQIKETGDTSYDLG